MVEIDKRYIHVLGGGAEIVMVESTHFSAFVFVPLAEKFLLGEFEGSPVEEFLIFIWSFLCHHSFLADLLEDLSLFLLELLEFDVIEALVVEKLAEDDV